jgi:SpoIID/LytB domain protein
MRSRRRQLGALAAMAVLAASLCSPTPTVRAAGVESLSLAGHGWGHGIGLSQWGAYGYAADHGWSAAQILDHYYGGTVAGSVALGNITVRLMGLDGAQTAVVHDGGAIVVDGVAGGPWRSLVIRETSERSYTVWARSDAAVCPSSSDPLGAGWTVVATGLGSVTVRPSTDTSASTQYGDLLAVCEPSGKVRSYRGAIRAVNGTENENRTVNEVPVEQYLRSVVASEMSASWAAHGAAALQAQAVAARSYGLAENKYSYAKTCDLVCQFYPGAAWRSSVTAAYTRVEQPSIDAAVMATAGVVRRIGSTSGPIAYTMFSASSGGWTAASSLGFAAVEDLGDATSGNPNHNWTATIAAAAIERSYPAIGDFTGIRVTQRTGQGDWGGRVVSMAVDGAAGSVTVSGDQFRRAMGLKSDWFNASNSLVPSAPLAPAGCGTRTAPPVTTAAADAPPARFQPIVPERLVDTRDGIGTERAPLGAGCTMAVHPSVEAGTTAVAVNIVTVDPSSQGYITAYPCGIDRPFTSAIQSLVDRVVSGSAVVPLGADGSFCVFSNITAEVVIDMTGSFSPSAPAAYEPIITQRRFDSRTAGAPLAAGSVVRVQTRGFGGGAPDSTAASLNIHAIDAVVGGFITAWPCDTQRPWASSANVGTGRSVANSADVAVSASGEVCLFVSAPMHLVVDLNGWFGPTASTTFHAVVPFRLADSREAQGLPGALARGADRRIQVGGVASVPAAARSVSAQFTAVDASREGWVTVHACQVPVPQLSMLRYSVRTNVAVLVNSLLDGAGGWCVSTNGSTQLVVDVSGWFG